MLQTIIVVSCKRSGHHAIINWILTNYNYGLPVDVHINAKYNYAPVKTNVSGDIIYYNDCDVKQPPNSHFGYHDIPRPITTQTAIYSFEDIDWTSVYNATQWLHPTRYIIICRDAINFLASRLAYYIRHNSLEMLPTDNIRDCWLSLTDISPVASSSNQFTSCIDTIWYHKWLLNDKYRNDICHQLQIINYDDIDHESTEGFGSSFIKSDIETGQVETDKLNYLTRYTSQYIPTYLHHWIVQGEIIHQENYPDIYQQYMTYTYNTPIEQRTPVKYFSTLAAHGKLNTSDIGDYEFNIYHNYWLYIQTRQIQPNYEHLPHYLLPIADKLSEANFRLVEYHRSRGDNNRAYDHWIRRHDIPEGDSKLVNYLSLQYKVEGSIILWYKQQYTLGFSLLDEILLDPDLTDSQRSLAYNNISPYHHVINSGLSEIVDGVSLDQISQYQPLPSITISHTPLIIDHKTYDVLLYDRDWKVICSFIYQNNIYWLVHCGHNYHRWLHMISDTEITISSVWPLVHDLSDSVVKWNDSQLYLETSNKKYLINLQHITTHKVILTRVHGPTYIDLTSITNNISHIRGTDSYNQLLIASCAILVDKPNICGWLLGNDANCQGLDIFWARIRLHCHYQKIRDLACIIASASTFQSIVQGSAFGYRYVYNHSWSTDNYYWLSGSTAYDLNRRWGKIRKTGNLVWTNRTIQLELV